MNQVTHLKNTTNTQGVLYMAFELGDKKWKLGFCDGDRIRQVSVDALDQAAVLEQIARAKRKFELPAECLVVSCYEAGWEGFWLARWLESQKIDNVVLDSSAIEVNRKAKRAKTDTIDLAKLMGLLIRHHRGEKGVLTPVRVPSVEAEDQRQFERDRAILVKERSAHWIRIQSLLRAQGLRAPGKQAFLEQLTHMRLWNGEPLPNELHERLKREWERHCLVDGQIKALEAEQRERVKNSQERHYQQIRHLMSIKSVGYQSAWTLVMEFFSWREITNRRQLAALAGLAPMPYQSGDSHHEQGISKAGNRRVRSLMVELAWMWLRFQPHSELSQWYMRRFGANGKRTRRVGIVALARKLLIELWRYLETGALPREVVLKTI